MRYKAIYLFIALTYFLSPVGAYSQDQKFEFIETKFGIFKTDEKTKNGRVSETTIQHNVLEKTQLVETVDRIPAKHGVEFGVEYVLRSKMNEKIRLLIEWRYPKPIVDPTNGAKIENIMYNIDLPTNMVNISDYTLEQDFEIVKGEWELLIYYNYKTIYSRKFVLE